MPDYTAEDIRERWNANAERYAANCSTYGDRNKEVLLSPTLLDMLGDIDGKRILDAGCGEGYLSRLMAERGASVVAIDYSDALLKIAGDRTRATLDVEYRHADFADLSGIGNDVFDLVVSVAALPDMPDYASALAEAGRVLKPSGHFLLVLLHPCFSADGGWVRDADGNKLYWKIDNYFREVPSEMTLYSDVAKKLVYFHRTLTSYVRAVISVGFTIVDLVEPCPSPEALERNREYEDDFRMSHYLILKLRKQASL